MPSLQAVRRRSSTHPMDSLTCMICSFLFERLSLEDLETMKAEGCRWFSEGAEEEEETRDDVLRLVDALGKVEKGVEHRHHGTGMGATARKEAAKRDSVIAGMLEHELSRDGFGMNHTYWIALMAVYGRTGDVKKMECIFDALDKEISLPARVVQAAYWTVIRVFLHEGRNERALFWYRKMLKDPRAPPATTPIVRSIITATCKAMPKESAKVLIEFEDANAAIKPPTADIYTPLTASLLRHKEWHVALLLLHRLLDRSEGGPVPWELLTEAVEQGCAAVSPSSVHGGGAMGRPGSVKDEILGRLWRCRDLDVVLGAMDEVRGVQPQSLPDVNGEADEGIKLLLLPKEETAPLRPVDDQRDGIGIGKQTFKCCPRRLLEEERLASAVLDCYVRFAHSTSTYIRGSFSRLRDSHRNEASPKLPCLRTSLRSAIRSFVIVQNQRIKILTEEFVSAISSNPLSGLDGDSDVFDRLLDSMRQQPLYRISRVVTHTMLMVFLYLERDLRNLRKLPVGDRAKEAGYPTSRLWPHLRLLAEMRRVGVEPNVSDYNAILNNLFTLGFFEDALILFHRFPVKRDVVTFTTAVTGLATSQVFSHFFFPVVRELMTPNAIKGKIDNVAFSAILNALGNHAGVDGKRRLAFTVQVFDSMKRFGVSPDLVTLNTLLSIYMKHGDLDGLVRVYRKMVADGIRPDVYTISILTSALCGKGHVESLPILLPSCVRRRAKRANRRIPLNRGRQNLGTKTMKLTPTGIVNACREAHIDLDLVAYGALSTACSRMEANGGVAAERVLAAMKRDGVQPNARIFGPLILAQKRKDIALKILGEMVDSGVDPDSGCLNALAVHGVGFGEIKRFWEERRQATSKLTP
ncbi:hypothetical protein HDU67_007847 [Dinochytrium kinnereticum]|nr:hypothetical protein HDU67_007847 [Dinochytrium kinnereticum]